MQIRFFSLSTATVSGQRLPTCSEVHVLQVAIDPAILESVTAVYCSGVFRIGNPEYSAVVFGSKELTIASVSSHASLCAFVRVSWKALHRFVK